MAPEDAKNFEKTLELGKKIAQDLSDSDVLGRWMAHHLSDLIIRAENTTGNEGLNLQREAFDLILRLWANRSGAPLDSRPTASFEPVVDALTRLSDDKAWHYYGFFPGGHEPDATTTQTSLLRLALILEQTVYDVVRHIIVVATKEAADKEAEWLRAAEHLVEDEHLQLARHVRRLELRLLANTDGDTPTLKTETQNPHAQSIETLRKAENRLADVRRALEEHSAVTINDTTNDAPT